MPLANELRIYESIRSNPNIQAIRILTSAINFTDLFKGNTALFFRNLKNGLHSLNRVPNRDYFKNLSGCYFSLEQSGQIEIFILYDAAVTPLNNLQTGIRIKKLLGLNSTVDFGDFAEYEERILEMISVAKKSQTFGEFYFNK